MESIDKLRDAAKIGGRSWLSKYADEIEREISERYMELPVDADGVPIRPREEVSTGVGDNGPIGHLEYWYPNHWVAVIEYKPGQFTRYDPAAIRHYKPRTLEDVLTDFAEAIEERGTEWVDVSQTANAIRELLRGDAE